VPVVNAFVGRDPMENAEDVERIYRRYQAAERNRQTWLYMLKDPARRTEAMRYLESHRAEISSVATKEMGGGTVGALRAEYEAIEKMGGIGRIRPDRRRQMVERMHGLTGAMKGRDE
jgi:hypothetical protein